MDLDTPLIRRLRQHLLEVAPSSVAPETAQELGSLTADGSPEELAILDRFRPFGQLFYLVASADGDIDDDERHVMRGAFESLTSGRVGRERLLELERDFIERSAQRDREDLLESVCSALAHDREDAELAFTLAAVVAVANRRVEDHEHRLVDQLASWLGLSQRRAAELLRAGQRSIIPPRP